MKSIEYHVKRDLTSYSRAEPTWGIVKSQNYNILNCILSPYHFPWHTFDICEIPNLLVLLIEIIIYKSHSLSPIWDFCLNDYLPSLLMYYANLHKPTYS